ncbi:VWA domain-containing protein [Bryobacter aggregatus]|uniref:VWA domain-containing protein n=1 Tax=Bryobacter aggregatus TaxID=360054 RepID=UPI0004E26D06|nr:VWA domain-containing protein [Bryobacter aggregatus]
MIRKFRGWIAIAVVASVAGVAIWAQDDVIRVTTLNIVAPTVVKDRDGNFINGLDVKDFVLRDNGKAQDLRLDQSYVPISLVLVIQRSASTEPVLPTVQKIGSMITPLIIGDRGEAAIVTYDHRIELKQDFTNDTDKFKAALDTLRPGSQTRAMSDAVLYAARMLKKRPKDQRRVIVLVSETQESGSTAHVKDALLEVELNNILVYSINMSRIMNKIMAKPGYPRPDPVPPSARPLPAGMANNPTTQAQMGGMSGSFGNIIPLFQEVFTASKAIFISNPQELYTRYTGGSEYSFLNLRGFETAVQKLGEELQSQYLLSYSPSNKLEGGWHAIEVEVRRGDATVKTRGGYWMAARVN